MRLLGGLFFLKDGCRRIRKVVGYGGKLLKETGCKGVNGKCMM